MDFIYSNVSKVGLYVGSSHSIFKVDGKGLFCPILVQTGPIVKWKSQQQIPGRVSCEIVDKSLHRKFKNVEHSSLQNDSIPYTLMN